MISTDFASNETWEDALLSFSLLFQPWRWKKGKELKRVKKELTSLFKPTDKSGKSELSIELFLSGRAALYFLLQSLELPKSSDIIIQAFTCEAVVLPIIALGHRPIYADIDPKTYSMSLKDLQKKITSESKVLILQHTFGITPDREKIIDFALKNKLIVIEDLAHGFNYEAMREDRFKTTKLLSFGRSKALSSVFGGAIVTSDKKIAKHLDQIESQLPHPNNLLIISILWYKPLTLVIKSLYDIIIGKILHMIFNQLRLLIPEISTKEKRGEFDFLLAKNYPNVLAILLLKQLTNFDQKSKQRSIITSYYNSHFADESPHNIEKNMSLIRFPILVKNREKLLKTMRRRNIYLGRWYDQVVGPKPLKLDRVKYNSDSCPIAEDISKQVINLPTLVTDRQAKKILKLITKHQKKNS